MYHYTPSYSKDNADRYSVVFGQNLFKTYQNLRNTKSKISNRIFKIADKLKEKNLHRSLSDLQKKGAISLNRNQSLSSVAFATHPQKMQTEQKNI